MRFVLDRRVLQKEKKRRRKRREDLGVPAQHCFSFDAFCFECTPRRPSSQHLLLPTFFLQTFYFGVRIGLAPS